MSLMTKTVSSECSSVSDIDYDPITSTFAKLRAVISQEASLRKELDVLFVKRTKEAHIAVQNAQNHLEMVKTQEAHMREILKTESAAANEIPDSASDTSPEDTARREQAVEWERLQEPALMSMLEQRHKDATKKLHQEQEENDLLAKLEEARLAELERERLAKEEEENRLAAEDAAIITAIDARLQNEAHQGQLGKERLAKEEQEAVAAMQAAAMVDGSPVVVALKKKKKGKKPKETPAAMMEEPPRSLTRFTHVFEPPRSPARSARGFDPTSSPARSACGLNDGPMPISPTRSNRGLPIDTPPRSPALSTRGLEDTYFSPDGAYHFRRTPGKKQSSLPPFSFGDNYVSGIEEPKMSPVSPVAALPTAFGGGGFGTTPGLGFGASPTANTTFGFGASPTASTGFAFGAGSQPPSASIGFGAVSSGDTRFGFGSTSPTINLGLRPHHPKFDSNITPLDATAQTPAAVEDTAASMDDLFADMMQDAHTEGGDTWGLSAEAEGDNDFAAYFGESRGKSPKVAANDYLGEQLDSGDKHDDVGVSGSGANGQNERSGGAFGMAGQEHVQTPPAMEASPVPEPPEEIPVVVVAPKKKKKGAKYKKGSLADRLAQLQPIVDADAEKRAVMEEIKLSEEDLLEAELGQLEAEEVQMAEQDRREEARLRAEAAENEGIDRELMEEERRLIAEEEASEYLRYLSLKEAVVVAEERLSMVQAELDALETQKMVILQQVESVREEEASCRYHEIMRGR